MLKFSNNPGVPPVLNDGVSDVKINNYTIGATNDPHWKIYPKDQFYSAPDSSPTSYAFTDYVQDAYHFVFYMPESSGPTFNYSILLRDHFNNIRYQLLEHVRREAERKAQENKEKILQIKNQISQETATMNLYIKELKKLETTRDKDIRAAAGRGNRDPASLAQAAAMVDQMNPLYGQTLASINILRDNIQRYENELKSYM